MLCSKIQAVGSICLENTGEYNSQSHKVRWRSSAWNLAPRLFYLSKKWAEKLGDLVQPFIITEREKNRQLILRIVCWGEKRVITNEIWSPSQSQLRFPASHRSSKRETPARSWRELLNLEHRKPNNYLLKNRICWSNSSFLFFSLHNKVISNLCHSGNVSPSNNHQQWHGCRAGFPHVHASAWTCMRAHAHAHTHIHSWSLEEGR